MSQDQTRRALLNLDGQMRSLRITVPSAHDYALLEELCFVRREAQAEANVAYEDWRVMSSSEAYVVYRAAQDRADAAQDQLACCASMLPVG
jgi:hypothetical protein